MAQLDPPCNDYMGMDSREPFPEDEYQSSRPDDDCDFHHDLAMEDGLCKNCGSWNLTWRDDSDPFNGYYDYNRLWCLSCKGWAD